MLLMMPLLLCMILMMKLLLCLILMCHLVNFLMNNLLGLERMKLLKQIIVMKVMMKILPPDVPEGYVMDEETARDLFACKDRYDLKKLLAKLKEKSLNARMKYDPAFATSPICISDKDYDFSIDPEIITLVESDPFYGYESETVVAHLTKLNDIATLFTHEEKIRY